VELGPKGLSAHITIQKKEKKMRKKLVAFVSLVLAGLVSGVSADDHMFTGGLDSQAPFNLQANLCTLNPGKTMAQYDRMVNDYFAWSVKNNVDLTFVRQVPLYSHADANNPMKYDFMDYLASDYQTAGQSWNKWLGTTEGKKLNERWSEIATCYVKMSTLYFQWGDVNALNEDDERVVTWNWCSRKEGVSADQLMAKHQSYAASLEDDEPAIGWAILVPRLGAANAPGQFAHLMVYRDFEGLMKAQQNLSEGGWRDRQDYYASYADCDGESVRTETIMRRPSN
tara:strand:+ start:324 stop:1172 length:849 start_codon:yes stop_codon:yes gene_type:complete